MLNFMAASGNLWTREWSLLMSRTVGDQKVTELMTAEFQIMQPKGIPS